MSSTSNQLQALEKLAKDVMNIVQIVQEVDERAKINRRWWVHPINVNREAQGDFQNLLEEIMRCDEEKFFCYTRMEIKQFHYLLNLVKPHLTKCSNRKGLPEALRLFITLRHLATGDGYNSLAFAFRVGKSTIQKIIPEVCDVLWEVLKPIYLPSKSADDWKVTEREFFDSWNFPHCVGAIDGKHITIQAPVNSGTQFFNYKKNYSVVLLAVSDAHYKFSYVDIGAYGSQSDGGVLNKSTLGISLENGGMNFPGPAPLPGGNTNVSYFLLGDEAFPLKPYMLTPYSGRFLDTDKYVYNKRLSRGRRVVENAFGILAARWRIYHRSITAEPNTVDSIIKATVVLHNMLCESSRHLYAPPAFVDRQDEYGVWINGAWRAQAATSQLSDIPLTLRLGSRNATHTAIQQRDYIKVWISSN